MVFRNVIKLWQFKDLLYTLTMHRLKVRYKQSVLGVLWAGLQPFSIMMIYTFVFSYIGRMPSNEAPYSIFAYTALMPWTYYSTALGNASSSLVSHSQLVTKVYFPREVLPLSYILAALVDLMVASTILACLMFYYEVQLTINVLYAIPIVLILSVFAAAMGFLFSAVQVRFRDIGIAMPLLLQIWMLATPVLYPLNAVPVEFRSYYLLNPMAGVIENFRRVVLNGVAPDFYALSVSGALSIILLIICYIYFKHVEATMADII